MSEQHAAPSTDELLAHAGWLKRLAERLVGKGDRAEDLVQETWLAALRHGPRRGESLRPWLATVLRNFASSTARTRARRSWREEQHARPESLPSTEELTARAEASRTLVEAVLALPENQRVVVLLRYFEQLPTPEIAARLGCPPSTVRSHLSRAVERLRMQLDRDSGGDRNRWVRCLAPLPAAAHSAPPIIGSFAMSHAAKLAVVALAAAVIGVGLWSALDENPAASPGPVSSPTGDQGDLVAPEPPGDVLEQGDGLRIAVDQTTRTVAGSAPVRGALLDPTTGEPLPWFTLGIAAGPAPDGPIDVNAPPTTLERITTDEQGGFRSSSSYDQDDVHLVPLEDWDRFEFFATRASWGGMLPRSPLALTSDPASPESSTALLESGPAFRLHCPQAEAIGWEEFAAMLSNSDRPWTGLGAMTHVIEEPVILARFLPLDEIERRGKLDTLHLLSNDGRWAGWARVDVRPGLTPGLVTIDISPSGSLRVDVSTDSAPQIEEALFGIWEGALDATELQGREPLGEFMASHSLSFGGSRGERRPLAFHQRHLPVGSYTLRTRSTGCADQVEQIELRQGEQRIEVVLRRTADANGRIEGLVVPRSGQRPTVECIAWSMLTGDDTSGSQRNTSLEWTEQDGRWSATFAFENLLDREYRVWITRGMRVSRDVVGPSYEPRDFRVLPDGPTLEFELIEPARARPLEVLAQDSATGEPLAKFQVSALLPSTGKEPSPVEGEGGRALVDLRGALEGGKLWVSAPGHAPLYTDLPVTADADGVLRTTVRLDPGWGAPVQVVILDGEQRQPATGVEVLADGRVVATTDERGVVWLSLGVRPERLSVQAPGLVLHRTSGAMDATGLLEEEPSEPMRENFYFVLRREP